MLDFIHQYMENRGQYIFNSWERDSIYHGIEQFLSELDIDADTVNSDNIMTVRMHLCKIHNEDLKNYFMYYPYISRIQGIVSCYICDGIVSDQERCEIYLLMIKLFAVGLEDKYVSEEVRSIMKCS